MLVRGLAHRNRSLQPLHPSIPLVLWRVGTLRELLRFLLCRQNLVLPWLFFLNCLIVCPDSYRELGSFLLDLPLCGVFCRGDAKPQRKFLLHTEYFFLLI